MNNNNKTDEKKFIEAVLEEFEVIGTKEDRQQRIDEVLDIVHTLLVSRLEELSQE